MRKRIFGRRKERMEKIKRKDIHNLYSSTDIIRMFKSSCMRWTGYAERTGRTRNSS
jgi:hypothetical protein